MRRISPSAHRQPQPGGPLARPGRAIGRRLVLLGLLATPLAAGLCSPPPTSAAASPSFGHVFVIVGENKSLSNINSADAPYIVNTLEPESAWFTDYSDVASGSLADYAALTSGQYASCETGGPCGAQSVPSIFSQLGNGAWEDWNESMPSNCDSSAAGANSTLNAYKPGHNPGLAFAGLSCSTYDVPAGTIGPDDMSAFNAALAAGTVPTYNFITPNLCEDADVACNGPDKIAYEVTEFNNFLSKEIPLIEASPAFGSNGVIFVTFDEGASETDPNTMLAVLGPQVVVGAYPGSYNHYSTLATIEQGLGLSCLANACTAGVLPAFGAQQTSPSVAISQPSDGGVVSGTVTMGGTAAAQDGASISQVQVSVDNGTPQVATGTANWSASIDTTALSNGEHTITATATDSNGQTSSATIGINVNNPVATSCPVVPVGSREYSQNVSVESSQTGWTGSYSSSSVVTRVEPAGGSYDGLWALQIGITSGSGEVGASNAKPLWVSSTTQGTTYTGSSVVSANVTGEKVTLTLTEQTPTGTKVGFTSTSVSLKDTNWHQVSDSYTAAATGDVLHYALHASLASPAQDFLADCLSLQSP